MPKQAAEQLKALADSTQDVGQIATVIALREVTAALERIAERQEKTDNKLDNIADSIHTIDKRVSLVERIDHRPTVEKNTLRIDLLEKEFAAWKTRVYTIASFCTIAWVVFGSSVENFLQRVF